MASVIKVNEIQDTSGNTALSIDSNGVVTKGVVPSWRVCLSASQPINTSGSAVAVAWDKTSSDNCFIQGGCTLGASNGRVTVPVSGVYQINFSTRYDGIGSGYIITRIERNASESGSSETYVIDGSPDSSYMTLSGSECFQLDANDTVRITVTSSGDTSWDIQSNSSFSGVLIG